MTQNTFLTPREYQEKLDKMPCCKREPYRKCTISKEIKEPNDCFKCLHNCIYHSLRNRDIANAMHFAGALRLYMEEMKVMEI